MLLSLRWLREFVPYEGEVQALADRLTMIGLEVEEIRHPFKNLNGVVVGHVVECQQHPQADKLSVCVADIGSGQTLNIVCGAPNVAAGQKVPVATIGTTLPNGLTLKKTRLRGVESQGMICAEDELGLGEDHDGIMVLDSGLVVGTPLIHALDLDEIALDIGVTPNRADCLSVLGVARETALAFDLPLTMPAFTVEERGERAESFIRVELPDPDLCPVYRGRVIEGVTIGKSPDWLRYRLLAIGQRPISNVVDVTNYIMFEMGQPLHAFDLDLLDGGVIRVERARDGDSFTTLDGQKHALTRDDMLIVDGEKAVGLAGVMGGANSEIHNGSSRVFLESALFKPINIRKTARRLNLPSEASYRFERGVDQPGSLAAVNRAAAMIAAYGGGELRPGVTQAEPRPWTNRSIAFRPERARKLLGLPLEEAFCRKTIAGMGCEFTDESAARWTVTAPSHRLDLEREVDLIEEIGRMYGMDRIPAVLPHVAKPLEGISRREGDYEFIMRVKRWASGLGLSEAINYSFVGQRDLDALNLSAEGRIPVANPLSEEQNVLRTALAPGLLANARHNIAQGAARFMLFEVARVFHADAASETTARETGGLGLLLHGSREREGWPMANEDFDYLDLKGLVEHLCETFHVPMPRTAHAVDHPWLSPCASLSLDGEDFGVMGRVEPGIADQCHARKALWAAELDLDLFARLAREKTVTFRGLPTFPPVRRDITVIAPRSLPMAQVTEAIESLRIKLLEDARLIDVFEPEGDGEERNLTLRLTFRHGERTLKDKEVDKERDNIAQSLLKALPVRL